MCNYLGTVDIDFEIQPLGYSPDNKPVFLRDIYPTRKEIQAVEQQFVIPAMFQQVEGRRGTSLKLPNAIFIHGMNLRRTLKNHHFLTT
jgi:aconitase A